MYILRRAVFVGMTAAVMFGMWIVAVSSVKSQPPAQPAAEPAPPPGQTYIGVKECSACHFKQYMSWKKSKHAKEAWESVPVKYRATPECLACHATGYGAATGSKGASTPSLAGTTCEACHGPGSEHAKVCKPFLGVKTLTPAQTKIAADSIYKILPGNVCGQCHITQGHKEHPKYQK